MLCCRTSAMLTRTRSAMPSMLNEVAAVVRNQRVDQQDVGAKLDETAGPDCCR